MISRRTFITAGILGATALATAGWLRGPHAPAMGAPLRVLDADAAAILRAVVPVMLAGALPASAERQRRAIEDTVRGIDVAIAGLPPAAQKEIAQLFALLALPPARWALARVTVSWNEAPEAEVRAFLERFRDSSFDLQRSAYGAIHQLTFAAWYGNPESWNAIGYAGPPDLGS